MKSKDEQIGELQFKVDYTNKSITELIRLIDEEKADSVYFCQGYLKGVLKSINL